MTVPWGGYPAGTLGQDLSGLSGLDEATWKANMRADKLGGFDAAHGIYSDMNATINDHSHTITELVEAYQQLIIQGQATVYDSDNVYYPSEGIVSVDVILIGAGGRGGDGRGGTFVSYGGGGGGGGGGEVHLTIPANLFTKSNGAYDGVEIKVGEGGGRGSNPVNGGGNSTIGSGANAISAGGGNGGNASSSATSPNAGGVGGVGMIPGGSGGTSAWHASGSGATAGIPGGVSVSAYSLNGGGGGGGGGGVAYNVSDGAAAPGGQGGAGGISPGGAQGASGTVPSALLMTGGGGGGGGAAAGSSGGAGAVPGGGGGGGSGPNSGGLGAHGRIAIIERFV